MNANWLGVISAVLAMSAAVGVYYLAQPWRVRTRVILLIFASLLSIPGLSFSLYYLHLFPEPDWYYEFRSRAGTELLLVPLGIPGGLLATLFPKWLRSVVLVGVGTLSIIPFVKPFIGPIPSSMFEREWNGDVCLQSTPSTCGAASVATILRHHGIETTEEEIARGAYSYLGGTEAWYMIRLVRRHGCAATFKTTDGFDPTILWPAVVGVRMGPIGHFIPILAQDGDRFLIGDPLEGPEQLTRAELLEQYDFTGFYLEVGKTP